MKNIHKKSFRAIRPKKIIIHPREEYKQYLMQRQSAEYKDEIRYFISDVRYKERFVRAYDGVDAIVNAASLKQSSSL